MFAALTLLATAAAHINPPNMTGNTTHDVALFKRGTVNALVGTPGFGLYLGLDTKAELSWVTERYGLINSSSFEPLDGTFEGYYYGRSISGTRGREVIRFGQATYSNEMGFTDLAPSAVGGVDGALALGGSATSFFGQASASWPEKIIGVRIPTNNQNPGVLNLGYTNADQYVGDLGWLPVIGGEGWRASFDGIRASGNRTASHPGRNFAVWDSNEETSAAPYDVVTAIYGNNPRINKITVIWMMPCDVIEGTTVRMRLGGRQTLLSRAALLRRDPTDPGQCIANFAVSEDDNVHLGRTFMRTWYTAFSETEDGRRIGLARPIFLPGVTMNSISINEDF
ncbi:acid protease [Cutaneotrichosporon oleaginosum]|uniref:Acid protease n=1 Tax=Cutaneotrichosporon oleaginosum TaxID=879819 RepID=A0A0J1B872_9TREE|nr:acid protease [Cutaneotrichosporon oleaginosum]KLT43969.1 acid protease [Cutaneotrichosporon oleaginosum]TXT04083.1 hypothetical protein COLE_07780 [Cutaneotrichosporon oleaginosum]